MPEMRWAESRPSELRHVESLLPLLSLGVLGQVHPPAATECLMQLVLRSALCERGWGPEQEPLLESVFVRADLQLVLVATTLVLTVYVAGQAGFQQVFGPRTFASQASRALWA